MRVIALLCWFDEPAWCLTELVASLADAGVDHLVAVDGAYVLFPGGRPRSAPEQWHALRAAAHGAGMGLTMHAPADLWLGNEVEKRTAAFELGHLVGEPGDWLYVADADEVLAEALGFRETLECAEPELEAGEIVLDQLTADGHQGQLLIRKLFRWQATGIRVQSNHYTYMTGDGRMLWCGMFAHPGLVQAAQMHHVRVEHRQMHRPPARLEARDRYYQVRDEVAAG